MQKWEYECCAATDGEDLKDMLNTYGSAGWELVSVIGEYSTSGASMEFFFKRHLPDYASTEG
jgi:hypothetical protein